MVNAGIWTCELSNIKNIGPARTLMLKRLGINTVGDLLYYFPREYDDRSQNKSAGEYRNGEQTTLKGVVLRTEEKRPRRNLVITRIFVDDGAGGFVAVWYNQPFIKRRFTQGNGVLLTGKIILFNSEIQLQVKDYEVIRPKELNWAGKITPVYSLTEGITQRIMRKLIEEVLFSWGKTIEEFLPEEILQKYVLPEVVSALQAMHFPKSFNELKMARRRFVFEEFFIHQMAISSMSEKSKVIQKQHFYSDCKAYERKLLTKLSFHLTDSQKKAWEEIRSEMVSGVRMNRLLQGDVGSGKTVICILAMLKAVSSGYQAALMVPTEILAKQHFLHIKNYLSPMGITVELITGRINKNYRKKLLKSLKDGKIGIVIGTHAMIQGDVEFKNLSLIVIDEQHRFGVKHRALLRQKGVNPDVLVMTATPIPRTQALTLYGDLEVSYIRELPAGRKSVETLICSKRQIDQVYHELKEAVTLGRQAYIVCPMVEESDTWDCQAAVELANFLVKGPLCNLKISLLHGGMKSEGKEIVMEQFRLGFVQVLVCTTIIEVGIDVPNASFMVIIDADRFGIAQLHQLRGRIGRGKYDSKCFLVSDTDNPDAISRLNAVKNTSDGFILAEKDLEFRGPGDFAGAQQWGILPYKVADPMRDSKALDFACLEARKIVKNDLNLQNHTRLAEEMKLRWQNAEFLPFD